MKTLLGILIVIVCIGLVIIVPYLLMCLVLWEKPFLKDDDYTPKIILGLVVLMVIGLIIVVGYNVGNALN